MRFLKLFAVFVSPVIITPVVALRGECAVHWRETRPASRPEVGLESAGVGQSRVRPSAERGVGGRVLLVPSPASPPGHSRAGCAKWSVDGARVGSGTGAAEEVRSSGDDRRAVMGSGNARNCETFYRDFRIFSIAKNDGRFRRETFSTLSGINLASFIKVSGKSVIFFYRK